MKSCYMISREVFFVILHVASVGFMLLSLWRLYTYIRRYKFEESQYTLLFGFVHLRWIALAYPVVIFLWIAASYVLLTT